MTKDEIKEIFSNLPADKRSAIMDNTEELSNFAIEIGATFDDVSAVVSGLMSEQVVKFPAMEDGYTGLMFILMCGFIAPYGSQTQISDEKRAKAKELAKTAKAAIERGEKFEIKEGSELYEDNELFNAYTSEFSKLIMIDRVNKATAKAAEIRRLQKEV